MPVEPVRTSDPVRRLGRTFFIGLAIPWMLSSFIRIHPVVFFGFPLALVAPRFLHRKRHPVVEWTPEDWGWAAGAIALIAAYVQHQSPVSLVRTLLPL
jgi:cobalamin biosynthesis protein CobD/CbiB